MSKPPNQHSSPKPVKQPGVHAPEIKEALNARAMYRTIIVVAVVFLLLACLAVISSASKSNVQTHTRPRAVVFVAPYLPHEFLEVAMASNKAPFLGLLSAANAIYARVQTRNADLQGSLVTLLTGGANTSARDLTQSSSFLQTLKAAGKYPIVLAPSAYWSGNESVNGTCTRVGMYDSECSGTQCPAASSAAYCNAAKKLLSCSGKAEIYTEDILDGFRQLIKYNGDILYAHADVFDGAALPRTREERLAVLSDISVLDGTIGKIVLAANERSRELTESWLIMFVGAGGNELKQVSLFMAGYANGNLLRFGPIPDTATLADIYPTLLNWFAMAPTKDVDRIRGMCSTGVAVANCDTTTNWP